MHRCSHHDHEPASYGVAFAVGIVLNVIFVAVEAGFGWWSNSLALLADAGHNLSDVLGLLVAWGGYTLAKVAPSKDRTYGWRGSTILAALFNALVLLIAVGAIAWEAIARFASPNAVPAKVVIVVAAVGVVINTITAILFMRGQQNDLNIRGAYLHMAADALLSLGVVLAGVLIAWTGFQWIDPTTSLIIAIVILVATWGLFKESFNMALHAVPKGIDIDALHQFLAQLPGVTQVHDVHVWAMSTTEFAMTAHLVKPFGTNNDQLIRETAESLHHRFNIGHTTIQIEQDVSEANCGQAEDGTL